MTMALDDKSDEDGHDGRGRVIAMPMVISSITTTAVIIWCSMTTTLRDDDDDRAQNVDDILG